MNATAKGRRCRPAGVALAASLVALVLILGCDDISETAKRANEVEVLRWKVDLKAGHVITRDDFDAVSVGRGKKEELNLVTNDPVNVTLIVGWQLAGDVRSDDFVRWADLVSDDSLPR